MKRTEIEGLLPAIFQRTLRPETPLYALLEVMEGLHAPSGEALEDLDAAFDPHRTPEAFVAVLAQWVNLDWLLGESCGAGLDGSFSAGTGRLRELVAAAAYLSQWRGTRQGLLRFLETATGVVGFAVDEQVPGPDGNLRPFHIAIRAPQAAALHKPLIERIVEREKPAYVTYEIIVEAPQEG